MGPNCSGWVRFQSWEEICPAAMSDPEGSVIKSGVNGRGICFSGWYESGDKVGIDTNEWRRRRCIPNVRLDAIVWGPPRRDPDS
ncbi:hypothetical protein HPP92_012245 [Vanilla planifolia]|uniref:Uncharacterized protein n=1 Tax=Vanilla planifolia TaxID=51239 RepID=A0A835R257_VANPL|nr:hypothetical protein HPP92_012245 [Vanilla planifolia]